MSPRLGDLVEQHVVVCCGTGGVGKTTVAAVLAIEGARRGRRTCVVTIDPAKRLADTLGVEALTNVPHEIEHVHWDPDAEAVPGGRLWALMLDTQSTFDGLVARYSRDEEQAQRILENTFYRNLAGALSGTQEYMAMEKLYELHESGEFDLIVVDTPPTRHALDFLDAPNRLLLLLDNPMFRLLMAPGRAYLRVAGAAVQRMVRAMSGVVGGEVVDDVIAFFRAFEGMEQGFRLRAAGVLDLLAEPATSFVLVTSPRRDAVEEAVFFARRLADTHHGVAALVVNRVHPEFAAGMPVGELRARARELARAAPPAADARAAVRRLRARFENLADFEALAGREREQLVGVADRIGTTRIAFVPYLAHDVHDFGGLATVGRHLFTPATSPG